MRAFERKKREKKPERVEYNATCAACIESQVDANPLKNGWIPVKCGEYIHLFEKDGKIHTHLSISRMDNHGIHTLSSLP